MSLNYQSERKREEVFEAQRSWGRSLEAAVNPAGLRGFSSLSATAVEWISLRLAR